MRATVLCFSLALCAGCVPQPKQAYTVEQIPQIGSLEEIMKVQAQAMDPQFGKRNQSSFTTGEFAALVDAGRRVQATSVTVRDKFAKGRPPGFAAYANRLHQQANDLIVAAGAQDAARSAAALRDMKETCKGCHREFR